MRMPVDFVYNMYAVMPAMSKMLAHTDNSHLLEENSTEYRQAIWLNMSTPTLFLL